MKGYEQTKSETYKKVILDAADTLATLFNPKAGTMLSWPRHVNDYQGHNTIMDNMMNLELLFWDSPERWKQVVGRFGCEPCRDNNASSFPCRRFLLSRGCI